jgi:two-component system phosphate regulon sensor histidine kinase PhoR
MNTPNKIAALLSFIISAFALGLLIVLHLPFFNILISVLSIGVLTYLSAFLVLKFSLFKELQSVLNLLDKIKKRNYDQIADIDYRYRDSPIDEIKQDITNFAKQKNLEINELQKLETFRREFLADVSHELKTPIFAAQGFIHTLLDGAMDDENVRDRFLNKAATAMDGLNALVQDLLTISQLESGEITMHQSHFDLRKITHDVFEQVEQRAQARKTKLIFNEFAPKSCYVHADKQRISQVMTNLIVNAIKYGKEQGTVVVNMNIDGNFVQVSVKDNGPGIEERHLSRIFERFYRIDKSRTKNQGGTGLGLSIVKHILEAHDSRIQVYSKLNEGTEFSFILKKGKVINEEG